MVEPETKPRKRRADTSLIVVAGIVCVFAVAAVIFALSRDADDAPSGAGMIAIPAGEYPLGLDSQEAVYETPRRVALDAFFIDMREVSAREYEQYVEQSGGTPPPSWPNASLPADAADQPVDGVSWSQADKYCKSLGKRLPSEAEWEASGRGLNGQLLPWPGAAGRFDVGPTAEPFGSEQTASQYGILGLRGGVWEWVADPYADSAGGQQVVRGGSSTQLADLAYRLALPDAPTEATGFRCASDRVAEGTVEPNSPVIYSDDFSDSNSGWNSFAVAGSSLTYDADETLRFAVLEPSSGALVPAAIAPIADSEVEVTTRLTTTPSGSHRYGLGARVGESGGYLFLLEDGGNRWTVRELNTEGGAAQSSELMTGPTPTEPGALVHRLRVRTVASQAWFELNGELVAQVDLGGADPGSIGLYVESLEAAEVEVHFDDLLVRDGPGRPFVDRS